MRAIDVKCPHCGASLHVVASDVDWVTCEYCGTRSKVQRRSRVFDIPRAPATRPPTGMPMPPIAVQAPSRAGWVAMLVVLLGVGAVIFVVLRVKKAITTSNMQWEGVGGMLVTDVDGDGAPDVVGRVRYVLNGDSIHVAAYSGPTGKRIWESPRLGTYMDTYQGVLGRNGDLLIFADAHGGVVALGVADGKQRWAAALPEQAKTMCAETGGVVRLGLADETVVRLRDDGTAADAEAGGAGRTGGATSCLPIELDRRGFTGFPSRDAEVPGMRVGAVIERAGGPRIALGNRDKGTAVPMIAILDGDTVRWASDVPGTDPLRTSPFAPEHAVIADDKVFVLYSREGGTVPPQLAGFELAKGKRLWDVPLIDYLPIGGIAATPGQVFVATWGHLQAFDPATGKRLYVIGER